MAEYRKVRPVKRRITAEAPKLDGNFWAKFTKPASQSFPGAASFIDFSPTAPHDLLVTASARLSILSGRTCQPTKSFSRFKGPAFSGVFRQTDGRLVAGGDEAGVVSVFDIGTRATLRQFKGPNAATRVVRWRRDGLGLFTGSDDKAVRWWDLATGTMVGSGKGAHTDYVRCGAVHPASNDTFVSGSYDHTLCIWDTRHKSPVARLTHGAPVESCLLLPGGAILLSAGGDSMKVWDVMGGFQQLHSMSNHAKTITCLTLDHDGTRLLSSSLDGHVKVYDLQSYNVVHSLRLSGALLCVGLSPDKARLVVGRADGSVTIRSREHKAISDDPTAMSSLRLKKPIFGGTAKHFQRGKNAVAGAGDFQVELHKRQRLAPYDVALKGFRYHDALDQALQSKHPRTIVAVMEELLMRRGLKLALSGRDEEALEPVLSFITRYIGHPDFSDVLADVTSMVLDSYAGMVGQSPVVDDLLGRLSRQVRAETSVEKELIKLVGAMDMVMAAQEGPGVMLDVTGGEQALVPVGEVGKKRGRVGGEDKEEEEEEEESEEEEEEEQEEDEEIDDGDSSEEDQRIEELLEDVEEDGEGEEDEEEDDDDDDDEEEDE